MNKLLAVVFRSAVLGWAEIASYQEIVESFAVLEEVLVKDQRFDQKRKDDRVWANAD